MAEDTEYEVPRQFPRALFANTDWIFALKLQDEELAASPLQLEAQNIGLGGMRFLANKKISIFTNITVQLLDKKGKLSPLQLTGKVVRVDETDLGLQEKTFGMAVEFTLPTGKTFQAMKTEIDRARK